MRSTQRQPPPSPANRAAAPSSSVETEAAPSPDPSPLRTWGSAWDLGRRPREQQPQPGMHTAVPALHQNLKQTQLPGNSVRDPSHRCSRATTPDSPLKSQTGRPQGLGQFAEQDEVALRCPQVFLCLVPSPHSPGHMEQLGGL